ncbi:MULTISPECIES: HNH endonuclease [Bordetella]|uniref:HNH endonuclease n=1 Tax=Bordetella TaxID=517 RepID=UPI001E5FA605|nr:MULTISPECIES: HNH endonuclease [Bordetella]
MPHRLGQALDAGNQDLIAVAQRLFWDTSNWQGLCWSCHSIKTAREDGGFGHPALRRHGY